MEKECGVVMLEAGRGTIALYKKTGNMAKPNFNVGIFESDVYQPQHLYITSNDEIKEGDWFYVSRNDVLLPLLMLCTGIEEYNGGRMLISEGYSTIESICKKIIATTDPLLDPCCDDGLPKICNCNLGLPQPSDKFIQAYIDVYNKGEKIEKVLVEYETISTVPFSIVAPDRDRGYIEIPKLKDNNIIIKKVKDSWTREEVINLLHSAGKYGRETANKSIGEMPNMMDKWIEENL